MCEGYEGGNWSRKDLRKGKNYGKDMKEGKMRLEERIKGEKLFHEGCERMKYKRERERKQKYKGREMCEFERAKKGIGREWCCKLFTSFSTSHNKSDFHLFPFV